MTSAVLLIVSNIHDITTISDRVDQVFSEYRTYTILSSVDMVFGTIGIPLKADGRFSFRPNGARISHPIGFAKKSRKDLRNFTAATSELFISILILMEPPR